MTKKTRTLVLGIAGFVLLVAGVVSAKGGGIGRREGNGRPHPPVFDCAVKYSIAMMIGFLNGESAIRIHREMLGHERNFSGYISGLWGTA